MSEIQPYKLEHLTDKVVVPENIENRPETDEEVTRVARYIYESGEKAPNKLPPEYWELERFFEEGYQSSYDKMRVIDVVPAKFDFLFQQYAVKKDEETGRSAFNTFGLYGKSYLEGLLLTVDDPSFRYLGGRAEESKFRKGHQAVLLGCSSISSAKEFVAFVKGCNPEATPIIVDIDPLAVKLAKESGAKVIQADAQRIPLEDASIDFVATNFLIPHLIDHLGSGKNTLEVILKEVSRILTPKHGRLVMVERLSKMDIEWVDYYADHAYLGLQPSPGGFESIKKAVIVSNRGEIGRFMESIPRTYKFDPSNLTREKITFKRLEHVSTLVFGWPRRRCEGWVRVGRPVVVKSSRGK